MRPDWLNVPVAPNLCVEGGAPRRARTSGPPTGSGAPTRSAALDLEAALACDPDRGRSRVILIARPTSSRSEWPRCGRGSHALPRWAKETEHHGQVQREPRKGSARPVSAGPPQPSGDTLLGHPFCLACHNLDQHRLDVALSRGRQAAERAKLLGVESLIAVAPWVDRVWSGWRSPVGGPPSCHDWVDSHQMATSEADAEGIALLILVGVAIAAAQMGLWVWLPGGLGLRSMGIATDLNPGVADWLRPGAVAVPSRNPPHAPWHVGP